MKVIWCVSETLRGKGDYDREVKFIKSLSSRGNNIWKSLLVLHNRPRSGIAVMPPAIQAALRRENCTLFDQQGDVGNRHQQYLGCSVSSLEPRPHEQRVLARLLHEDEPVCVFQLESQFQSKLDSKLEKIPSCQVLFRYRPCKKCGVSFDERFKPKKCHLGYLKYHDENLHGFERIHPGNKTFLPPRAHKVGAKLAAWGTAGGVAGGVAGGGAAVGAAVGAAEGGVSVAAAAAAAAVGGVAVGVVGGALAIGSAAWWIHVKLDEGYNKKHSIQYWDCCSQPVKSRGCVFSCCGQKVGAKEVPVKEGCLKFCIGCREPYANQNGCTEGAAHA
jgi:hypothetical protein